MKLFSEIYGTYFRCAEKILSQGEMTEKDIRKTVSENAFRDSLLFIPDKLIPNSSGNSPWGLLKWTENGKLRSVLSKTPPKTATSLQKSWLKAKLTDPKFRLFLSDEAFSALSERLKDVKPLYDADFFREFDRFSDGDPYTDPHYREIFGTVLKALREKELLTVEVNSRRNARVTKKILPLKIEYSRKNDKFRLYCTAYPQKKAYLFNIGRIKSAVPTGKHIVSENDMDEYFRSIRCERPVTVEISNERNAVERFMMEFAAFEKRSEFDLKTGSCTASIWYDKHDETELLIMLLGFGPVLKVTGPEDFLKKFRERINRQYELFFTDIKDI